MEGLKDPAHEQKIRDVYERACTIHHLKKPNIHFQWATFEESVKNFNRSAEILVNLERSVPNLLQVRYLFNAPETNFNRNIFQVAYRRINLERRRGESEKVCQLYEHYISTSKSKLIASNLAIKYARFNLKVIANLDKSLEIINTAITKDLNNPRLFLQLIDLTLQREGVSETEIVAHLDAFLTKDNIDLEQKVLFSQRKLEFLEDFGSDIITFQKASEEYQKYLKTYKDIKKKEAPKTEVVSKKDKTQPAHSSQSTSYNYSNYSNAPNSQYQQYSGPPQGQYNYPQYGQNEQYQYQNWQYSQGGYGGYNQWGGYGGGYGY